MLFGWALPSFLKGKWSYLISLLGLGLVAFAYFDGAIVITYKIWLGLLGVIMIGWGLPFNNRKGRRAMTIFGALWQLLLVLPLLHSLLLMVLLTATNMNLENML